MNRRDSLKVVVGAFGAAAAYYLVRGEWAASEEIKVLGDIPKALGSDRLHSDAEAILAQFATAPSGPLMAHYQTFWTFALDKQARRAIAQACAANLDNPKYASRAHRVRTLAPVANIHALPWLRGNDHQEASEAVIDAHQDALEFNPHREVMEILWQNVTAAIVRSKESWNTISLDNRLLGQGVEVCKRFLQGEDLLLHPSVSAFHAICTYRNALVSRRETESARAISGLLEEIFELETTTKSKWFSTLGSILMEQNGFDQALPQQSEIFMGHANFSPQISSYSILVRLYMAYLCESVAEGKLSSRYEKNARAQETQKIALSFIGDYGITQRHWMNIRPMAEQFLSALAVGYLDEVFAHYGSRIGSILNERGEGEGARRLASLIPFRRFDERVITDAAYGAGAETLASRAFSYGPGLLGLLKVCEPGIQHLAGPGVKLQIEEVHDLIKQDISRSELNKPLELYEEALQEAISATRTVVGGPLGRSRAGVSLGSPDLRETVMNLQEEKAQYRRNREILRAEMAALGAVDCYDEMSSEDRKALRDSLKEDPDRPKWVVTNSR
jgi:hypothetical protein